ncbi:hypothetical protein ARD30_09960 [Bosea thiooxidans]|uniref:Uncharacterized protein n=1 Tax=Bosea thiooxidans TaxID=53254 RepID=A0A0Q3PMW3_9HYPH|nr:hypothetical protein ARD30_09960 [Bosea thiooxidans]
MGAYGTNPRELISEQREHRRDRVFRKRNSIIRNDEETVLASYFEIPAGLEVVLSEANKLLVERSEALQGFCVWLSPTVVALIIMSAFDFAVGFPTIEIPNM